jgi:type I restriction enzyme S subunit
MARWIRAPLGELTSKIGSGATPLGGEAAYQADGISLIRSLNVHDGEFRRKDLAFLSQEQADGLANVVVQSNDVLLNITGASVARCCTAPDDVLPARVNQHVAIIRPHPDRLSPRFLQYLLVSSTYKDRLLSAGEGAGATRQALTKAQLQSFLVEFPESLQEQARIVAILDEAFEGIATAKAHAERNLRSAREVRDTFLAAQFSPAPHWISGPLSAFVESVSTGPFGSVLHKSDYVANGVPLVNPINIVDGDIVPTDEKQVDAATALRLRSYLLRSGDIVVGRRGEIGRCAVVSDVQEGWLCGTGCFFIRPSSRVQPSFMAHLIRSARYRARLEALSTGTTMQNLSNGALSGLEVVLPDLAEQKRLLAEIDAMSAQTDLLREVYERKLAALDELQQSLLHQAFSGAL